MIIGRKPERCRPSYGEIKRLRVAVGLNDVGIHIVGASRYMHNVFQNGSLLSA